MNADHIYSDILQNAPFSSQIFKFFFRLRRQGGIDPPNQNPADPLAIRNVLGDDWLCTGDWSACPYKDVVAT